VPDEMKGHLGLLASSSSSSSSQIQPANSDYPRLCCSMPLYRLHWGPAQCQTACCGRLLPTQAAACGASLAAAAANVPLHNLVAGISIGLLCEKWPKPCGGMAGGPVLGPAGWQWEEDLGRYALLTGESVVTCGVGIERHNVRCALFRGTALRYGRLGMGCAACASCL
jgi:hypothetical protein